MNTSVAKIPTAKEVVGKAPLFLTPTDAAGNPVLYKIIAETAPLIREMESRWTDVWKSTIEGPRAFAAQHSHIAATYQLFWLLQKVDVDIVNAALLKQDRFPVNLVETWAFLTAYPEYTEVLEEGPFATGSLVGWINGPGPMRLAIHPSHPSLRTPAMWPTLGNKMMWPDSVILARTSEIVSTPQIETADAKQIPR